MRKTDTPAYHVQLVVPPAIAKQLGAAAREAKMSKREYLHELIKRSLAGRRARKRKGKKDAEHD